MKKQINYLVFTLGFCLFVFFAMPASAQFSAGIGAGANLATQPATGFQHEFLALPYGGIFGRYQLPVPIAIQLGVDYSGEGVNLKDLSTSDFVHSRLSYLTVPLFAQYHFSFGGYVELGPQFGFLLSAKESADGENNIDTKEFYKSTDISGGIGLGYEFKNGLGIGARYLRSFSSIEKGDDEETDSESLKNRILSIGLTYRLLNK